MIISVFLAPLEPCMQSDDGKANGLCNRKLLLGTQHQQLELKQLIK